MADFPDDIMEAAKGVMRGIATLDWEEIDVKIARALMAERERCKVEAFLNPHTIIGNSTTALVRGGKGYQMFGVSLTDEEWDALAQNFNAFCEECHERWMATNG